MTSTGPNLLLTAKIRGFCSRLAEVRTPSNTLVAKAKGVGFYEWSFAYAGAVFQWKVSKRRKQWSLVDPGGRVVASFDRASRLSRKEGVLRVVGGLDQQLVRLCMLTCKMVHDTITMIEGSSASGGAGGGP
ncbi:hypothetical protein IWW50_000844 [Coemansia erecta]|nr:hypothetical protein IWW50_000844 [Coemansia erecta]